MPFDLIVRGGQVVAGGAVRIADVGVRDGTIATVQDRITESADDEIDAVGLHVLPGGIDSHVHFNEPGRTEWETIADGSAALAGGGYTAFIDMPLNNLPVTTTPQAFDLKLAVAQRSSLVDFGLWGGLIPGNVDQLEELHARGAMGFKAFMCPSGIDEFPASDQATLRSGMQRIARLGSILLVHAEDPKLLAYVSPVEGLGDAYGRYAAEFKAILDAAGIARDTGCRLHIVHVSTRRGVRVIVREQKRGLDISGETCPHYLLYTDDDLQRLGGLGKCSPPLRSASNRDALWQLLAAGSLAMVVSDHSPSTLELKQGDDFSKLWGGISGCQSTRQLLLATDRLDLPAVAALTSTSVARRFGIAHKGEIAPGFDADLWLVDLSWRGVVRREDLLYRNRFSAHEGTAIRGRTVRTLVRGRTVYANGKISTDAGGGRFIRPAAPTPPPVPA